MDFDLSHGVCTEVTLAMTQECCPVGDGYHHVENHEHLTSLRTPGHMQSDKMKKIITIKYMDIAFLLFIPMKGRVNGIGW